MGELFTDMFDSGVLDRSVMESEEVQDSERSYESVGRMADVMRKRIYVRIWQSILVSFHLVSLHACTVCQQAIMLRGAGQHNGRLMRGGRMWPVVHFSPLDKDANKSPADSRSARQGHFSSYLGKVF